MLCADPMTHPQYDRLNTVNWETGVIWRALAQHMWGTMSLLPLLPYVPSSQNCRYREWEAASKVWGVRLTSNILVTRIHTSKPVSTEAIRWRYGWDNWVEHGVWKGWSNLGRQEGVSCFSSGPSSEKTQKQWLSPLCMGCQCCCIPGPPSTSDRSLVKTLLCGTPVFPCGLVEETMRTDSPDSKTTSSEDSCSGNLLITDVHAFEMKKK